MPPLAAPDKHASVSHSRLARFGFFGGLAAAAVLAGGAAVAWPLARTGLRGCGFAMLPFDCVEKYGFEEKYTVLIVIELLRSVKVVVPPAQSQRER